ncbi:hypothetical protein BFR04_07195 [Gaetbulibacter sp. 4G1]|nr:glycosyltransferase family 2 protein [Gaetbulibacter sp. 4G1]PIA78010.1 hypothetical protein BFR04_07195 [Gaetbulibacter sp. 4G1]
MRKGENLSKDQILVDSSINHRIIIPLYIPSETGYYEEAFSIFKMSLISLAKTTMYKNSVTVIADGCCDDVNDKLLSLYKSSQINELIIERTNIGKVNAILKALRTVTEPFVTITDADILFLNDWDKEVFNVFKVFKKAAVVSPIPVFRKQFSFTVNIWVDYLFSKKLKFRPVKNPEALERFAQSIGWNTLEHRFKDVIMTLKENDTTVVISAVHCVATYKTDYLKTIPKENSKYKLGGDSEGLYLDAPPFNLDGYRLSTYNNYAYHIGNKKESWLDLAFKSIEDTFIKSEIPMIFSKKPRKKSLKYFSEKILLKLIKNKRIYNYLLLKKGLSKAQLKTFWY